MKSFFNFILFILCAVLAYYYQNLRLENTQLRQKLQKQNQNLEHLKGSLDSETQGEETMIVQIKSQIEEEKKNLELLQIRFRDATNVSDDKPVRARILEDIKESNNLIKDISDQLTQIKTQRSGYQNTNQRTQAEIAADQRNANQQMNASIRILTQSLKNSQADLARLNRPRNRFIDTDSIQKLQAQIEAQKQQLEDYKSQAQNAQSNLLNARRNSNEDTGMRLRNLADQEAQLRAQLNNEKSRKESLESDLKKLNQGDSNEKSQATNLSNQIKQSQDKIKDLEESLRAHEKKLQELSQNPK